MVFTTYLFVFYFLPLVLVLYYALNGLAQFRDGTGLGEATVYATRREPRTPGIVKTG